MLDFYFLAVPGGQMLSGLLMAVGVIVGLRLALPSLARALARELDSVKQAGAEAQRASEAGSRPVVTLHPHDELKNG